MGWIYQYVSHTIAWFSLTAIEVFHPILQPQLVLSGLMPLPIHSISSLPLHTTKIE